MKDTQKKWIAGFLLAAVFFCASAFSPTSGTDGLLKFTSGGNADNAGDTVTISREEYERLKQYAELEEIRQMVDSYYYQDADEQKMLDYAAYGMLSALEDPYTFYYTPEAFAELWEDDEGEYAGVGLQITTNYQTDLCTISRVFLDSPALEAGLRKGDILRRVEDIEVNSANIQDAVDIMRGKIGEYVNLTVERSGEMLDFRVVRAQVHVNWVNSCMLDDQIGYICLYDFSGDCADTFRNHLKKLEENGAKALVLDLRDNPGGWLDDANAIADMFLDKGVLATLHYKDGSTESYTTGRGVETELPLVVLLNENSASSSEVLSGALQDRGRATIVGVQSYGKGIVQVVLEVGDRGAGLQMTIASYRTPNGNEVHKIGITPDIAAELPEGDVGMYELGDLNDAQLQVAYQTALDMVK